MRELTKKEEELMQILWRSKRAFVKEIRKQYPEPKPHYNTLSTIIRNLQDKGYVAHKVYGNTHQYYPLISKEEYRNSFMGVALKNYFNNSYKNLVSFFAKNEKITVAELKEIIKLIENQENNKR